jgi:hypothetical protein
VNGTASLRDRKADTAARTDAQGVLVSLKGNL